MGDAARPKELPDVLFVGQTGVGKSSLINMIRGVKDNADGTAKVSNDAHPCTTQTTPYLTSLGGLECQLWDIPGLNEAVGAEEGRFKRFMDWILQSKNQQHNKLAKELRDRTKSSTPILVWCIDAAKVDIHAQYEPFQEAYVDYCGRNAIPVIVITRLQSAEEAKWKEKCSRQVGELKLGEGSNTVDVPLRRVRWYSSSKEYLEDVQALKDLIFELMKSRLKVIV